MWMLDLVKSGLGRMAAYNEPRPQRPDRGGRVLVRNPVIDFNRDMDFLDEQMRVYAGVNRTRHNIFADNWTGETREMRLAYRKALAEPTVKAALLEKIISVCRLKLQITPTDKRSERANAIAKFCTYAVEKSKHGTPGILWGMLSGGLLDGWSLGEKIPDRIERGQYRGLHTIRQVKAKDTRYIQIEIDPFRNVTAYYSMRGNAAHRFDPAHFIHFSYLSLFENPTGMSDLRGVYRAIQLMPAVVKMRAVFLEKFCGPWIKGKLSNNALREKMAQQLADARARGFIVLDQGTDVEVIDMATRGTSDFQACIEDLRQEMAIGISGAFLHMMTGNAGDVRGDSQVQQGTVDSFVWWLATLAAGSLQEYLVPDLVDPNFGAAEELPTCTLSAVNPADIRADLEIDKMLLDMGGDLDMEEVYDRARRTVPTDESRVLKGRSQGSPGGDNPFAALGGGNPPGGPPAGPGDGGPPTGPENPTNPQNPPAAFAEPPAGSHPERLRQIALLFRNGRRESETEEFSEQEFDAFAEGQGFTGTVIGKDGRHYHYVNGKRIKGAVSYAKGGPAHGTTPAEHVAAKEAAKAAIGAAVLSPHALTPDEIQALPSHLAKLTGDELHAVRKSMGIGSPKSRYKNDLVAKVAAHFGFTPAAAAAAKQSTPDKLVGLLKSSGGKITNEALQNLVTPDPDMTWGEVSQWINQSLENKSLQHVGGVGGYWYVPGSDADPTKAPPPSAKPAAPHPLVAFMTNYPAGITTQALEQHWGANVPLMLGDLQAKSLASPHGGKWFLTHKGAGTVPNEAPEPSRGESLPDPAKVKVEKQLGGSTGAKLVNDDKGRQWVMKTTGDKLTPAQLQNEATADAVYRAIGVPVVQSGLVQTPTGPVKFARYRKGQTLGEWEKGKSKQQVAAMHAKIAKHAVADMLLANWDVVGLDKDNVLVDDKGVPFRIDNGGALLYRAQGPPKGAAFGSTVGELTSMRDPYTNANTAEIYGGLTDDDLRHQAKELVGKKAAILSAIPDPTTKAVVAARLDHLAEFAKGPKVGLPPDAPPEAVAFAKPFKYTHHATKNEDLPDQARPDLSDPEKNALHDYTGTAYDTMNKSLYKGKPLEPEDAALHWLLMSAMAKAKPLPNPVLVHRGIGLDATDLQKMTAKMEQGLADGRVVKLPGFQSTATDPNKAFKGNVRFKIKATHGIDTAIVGHTDESEYLLPHNASYRVVKIEKPQGAYGKTTFHLEQIAPGQPGYRG